MKRQIFGIVVGVSALFMTGGLVAGEETLVKWGADTEVLQKEWSGKIKYETVDDKLCGVVDNKKFITSKKFIPVEAGKKYTLSGTFKSLGEAPSIVYYGFRLYDKNKRSISPLNTNIVAGSDTTLAQDCKKGDKTLVIKANKKWRKSKAVAFNTKDDFSDLPNYEIVYKVTKIVLKGENMELELSKPVAKAYSAETKVREHTPAYGSFLYTVIAGLKVPKTWKSYSDIAIHGEPGEMSWQIFRPGTAFVKIVILPNYGKRKDEKIAFTDLTLKVSE